jgi:cytochrome c553
MESGIQRTTKNIEAKKAELSDMEKRLMEARDNNSGSLQVCGKCHLIEGHTERNCELGQCMSVKACELLKKHPEEKGRKLKSDISSEITSLNKLQKNGRKKTCLTTKSIILFQVN